jgi:hypothetical protein
MKTALNKVRDYFVDAPPSRLLALAVLTLLVLGAKWSPSAPEQRSTARAVPTATEAAEQRRADEMRPFNVCMHKVKIAYAETGESDADLNGTKRAQLRVIADKCAYDVASSGLYTSDQYESWARCTLSATTTPQAQQCTWTWASSRP